MKNFVKLFDSEGKLTTKYVGAWKHFSGHGMHFDLQTFDFDGCAHISELSMRAMGGIMKMDTLICTPYGKDLPLYSLDLINVMGKKTLLVEVYDTQIEPADLSTMDAVKEEYNSLKNKKTTSRWYDTLHLSPTCSKVSWGNATRRFARKMTSEYVKLFDEGRKCSRSDKMARSDVYVEGLIKNGGPAIDTINKMFGKDITAQLFREHIFGTI